MAGSDLALSYAQAVELHNWLAKKCGGKVSLDHFPDGFTPALSSLLSLYDAVLVAAATVCTCDNCRRVVADHAALACKATVAAVQCPEEFAEAYHRIRAIQEA